MEDKGVVQVQQDEGTPATGDDDDDDLEDFFQSLS